jgi:hypothetical protein
MLVELQEKLMLRDDNTQLDIGKRRGENPEKHLELYLQTKARKSTHDLPQAILL